MTIDLQDPHYYLYSNTEKVPSFVWFLSSFQTRFLLRIHFLRTFFLLLFLVDWHARRNVDQSIGLCIDLPVWCWFADSLINVSLHSLGFHCHPCLSGYNDSFLLHMKSSSSSHITCQRVCSQKGMKTWIYTPPIMSSSSQDTYTKHHVLQSIVRQRKAHVTSKKSRVSSTSWTQAFATLLYYNTVVEGV